MTAPCRVLVIGRSGQLARELARASWPGDWSVRFAARPELDLAEPEQAAAAVTAAAPDIVVNAAAYTDVERAESEPERALAVNAAGPAAVAAACAKLGAPFLAVSTDYVFDGRKPGPYVEDDPVNPISAYGRSKAEGEALVAAAAPRHLILRTSWVFSPFGTNFVRSMMRFGRERSVLRIVADQRGCPTAAGDLARAIVALCQAIRAGNGRYGTYHVTNSGVTTWHGLAQAIFEDLSSRGERVPDEVLAITTAEYPTKAARPHNSVLDCSRLQNAFGLVLRPWRAAVAACVDELVELERRGGDEPVGSMT